MGVCFQHSGIRSWTSGTTASKSLRLIHLMTQCFSLDHSIHPSGFYVTSRAHHVPAQNQAQANTDPTPTHSDSQLVPWPSKPHQQHQPGLDQSNTNPILMIRKHFKKNITHQRKDHRRFPADNNRLQEVEIEVSFVRSHVFLRTAWVVMHGEVSVAEIFEEMIQFMPDTSEFTMFSLAAPIGMRLWSDLVQETWRS